MAGPPDRVAAVDGDGRMVRVVRGATPGPPPAAFTGGTGLPVGTAPVAAGRPGTPVRGGTVLRPGATLGAALGGTITGPVGVAAAHW